MAQVTEITHPDGTIEKVITPDAPAPLKMLTVEDIAGADDVLERLVPVPEWGGQVRIRQFTKAVEFEIRRASMVNKEFDRERSEMLLLIYGVIDPKLTEEHIGMLKARTQVAVDRILTAISKINSIGEGTVAAAQATFPQGTEPSIPVLPDEGVGLEDGSSDAGGDA